MQKYTIPPTWQKKLFPPPVPTRQNPLATQPFPPSAIYSGHDVASHCPISAENGKETVDNNGKWNVYKGGKLVKQYEGFGRTPEQMKELCKKIQNEFK